MWKHKAFSYFFIFIPVVRCSHQALFILVSGLCHYALPLLVMYRYFLSGDGCRSSSQVRVWGKTCWTGCSPHLVSRVTWTWFDSWSSAMMLMSETAPFTAMSLPSLPGCRCTPLHEQVGQTCVNNLTIFVKRYLISIHPVRFSLLPKCIGSWRAVLFRCSC